MITCKRCGLCCHSIKGGELKDKCTYLIKVGSITACRIYSNRHKRRWRDKEGKNHYCMKREESPFDYPGCPYNKGLPLAIMRAKPIKTVLFIPRES